MQNICAKDFYKQTPYNFETKNQLWCTIVGDAHDNFCGCHRPFAHLLASIFPPGHTDRDLSINQILARDYTEKCLSGGGGETSIGEATEGPSTKERNTTEEEREELTEEAIEELISAIDDAEQR